MDSFEISIFVMKSWLYIYIGECSFFIALHNYYFYIFSIIVFFIVWLHTIQYFFFMKFYNIRLDNVLFSQLSIMIFTHYIKKITCNKKFLLLQKNMLLVANFFFLLIFFIRLAFAHLENKASELQVSSMVSNWYSLVILWYCGLNYIFIFLKQIVYEYSFSNIIKSNQMKLVTLTSYLTRVSN